MKLNCFCLPLGFGEEEVSSDCLGAEGSAENLQAFLCSFMSFREHFSVWAWLLLHLFAMGRFSPFSGVGYETVVAVVPGRR